MQIQEFARQMSASPTLLEQVKSDPVAALEVAGSMPLQTDVWIYRVVVGSMGAVVLTAMLGAILLAVYGKPIPDVITALGSAAVGAMAGLLAPSPNR